MAYSRKYIQNFHHDTYPALQKPQEDRVCAGKVAFVTGAGTGIGKAAARAFANAGARAVFIAGRTETNLADTKAVITKEFPDTMVEYFVLDICDETKVAKAFKTAVEKAGVPVDVLINNAAYISYQTTNEDLDKLWRHFEVNVKGVMNVVREFLKNSVSHGATLVNVCSGAAILEYVPGLCPYSASKLAGLKLMDYLHNEEKDRRGLRVFNIQPGNVATAMAAVGKTVCDDAAELPAAYCVWLTTPAADFLRGRFTYANWDVDELASKKSDIVHNNELRLAFQGFETCSWK